MAWIKTETFLKLLIRCSTCTYKTKHCYICQLSDVLKIAFKLFMYVIDMLMS